MIPDSHAGWAILGLAGLVAGRITNVAGASEVFRGSVVSYASEVKFDLLGVPEGPVVSEAAAAAMATGAAIGVIGVTLLCILLPTLLQ